MSADGYDICFRACKPCESCGQHIPKERTPPLCSKCALVGEEVIAHVVTAVSTDTLREDIADALVVELDSLGISGEMSCRASEYLADAMLSRVLAFAEAEAKRRAAEELRAAADALTDRVRTWVLNDLRDRAEALDACEATT